MSNSHWQAFMKHRHLSEHDQLFTEFFDYSPLEGETTQDYKTGGEALQKDYLKQRDEWLRTLTRKVLPGQTAGPGRISLAPRSTPPVQEPASWRQSPIRRCTAASSPAGGFLHGRWSLSPSTPGD
ncbi:hypothetical protein [Pseudomonas sp. FEN]|uniref:hypothetical protein n=1 Tax=Pseudomonas sp. FEN TaxID=2767468 RepID=UPI00174BDD5D|nr:hypothetical protein [Pseudomonas sp. FEN]